MLRHRSIGRLPESTRSQNSGREAINNNRSIFAGRRFWTIAILYGHFRFRHGTRHSSVATLVARKRGANGLSCPLRGVGATRHTKVASSNSRTYQFGLVRGGTISRAFCFGMFRAEVGVAVSDYPQANG
jgi:hypothetical protein